MSISVPVRVVQRPFGDTARRDTWWIQPLVVFLGIDDLPRLLDVGGVPGQSLHVRSVSLTVLLTRKSSATRRTAGSARSRRAWPAWLPFSPALLILPIPGLFRLTCYYYRGAYYKAFWADPPSCTVGEPRSSYWGENSFPLILQNVHRYMLFLALAVLVRAVLRRVEGAVVHRSGDRAPCRSASASARSSWPPTRCSSAAICSAVTRCVISSGGVRRPAVARADRRRGLRLRELPEPAAHVVGVVQPRARSASLTCTSACARWACGRTSGSSDAGVSDTRTRRAGHRRRRSGAAGGDRSLGGRRLRRARLQVAARQGAHRDGRGRHRGGAGQRRRPRQLEGSFRRHDARRPVREQLAHGGAAREGSARPRARARGVGRGVRSHARTARSSSATSAATAIRGWRTSATAPASR